MDEKVHELIEQRFEKLVKDTHRRENDAFFAIREFNAYVQAFHDIGLITDEEFSTYDQIYGDSNRRHITRVYPNGDCIVYRPGEKTPFRR